MKKIYNCKTGKLTESINTSNSTVANKLYEQRNPSDINDVIENAREIHTTNELGRYLQSSKGTVVFWEYTGNGVASDVVDVYENNDLSICRVDARNLSNSSVNDFYHGEDVIVVSSLTRCNSYDAVDITEDVNALASQSVKVIYVCSLDSANANEICDILDDADHIIYSPQYDRANYYNDLDDDDYANESVTERFAKNRKLYEGSDDDADADDAEGEDAPDDEDAAPAEDDAEKDTTSDDAAGEDEETEDVPMTAIILTVAKDDADKCKDEMVEAGIPEDGIEILDDDDDDNAKVKVDADYAFELKDYLAGKGIDLEEKIGGEIVGDEDSDNDEDSADETPEDGENKDDDNDSEDAGDFDAEFGDLFGDVEESK